MFRQGYHHQAPTGDFFDRAPWNSCLVHTLDQMFFCGIHLLIRLISRTHDCYVTDLGLGQAVCATLKLGGLGNWSVHMMEALENKTTR